MLGPKNGGAGGNWLEQRRHPGRGITCAKAQGQCSSRAVLGAGRTAGAGSTHSWAGNSGAGQGAGWGPGWVAPGSFGGLRARLHFTEAGSWKVQGAAWVVHWDSSSTESGTQDWADLTV